MCGTNDSGNPIKFLSNKYLNFQSLLNSIIITAKIKENVQQIYMHAHVTISLTNTPKALKLMKRCRIQIKVLKLKMHTLNRPCLNHAPQTQNYKRRRDHNNLPLFKSQFCCWLIFPATTAYSLA